MSAPRRARLIATGAAATALVWAAATLAQRVDPRVPQTFTVGSPRGPSPTLRGDAARRGRSPALPASPRVAWRKSFDKQTSVAPLVREGGGIVYFTDNADLIELDPQGVERGRVGLGSARPLAAALLSDDSVLVGTLGREIVVVRGGAVVGRRRVTDERDAGGARTTNDDVAVSVLPLDDGGGVLAFDDQLVAVDRDGAIRARATMPAALVGQLVAADDTLVATLGTGSVVGWRPGAEVRRLGRLAGSVSRSAARIAPNQIAAVVDAQSLVRFDVARGAAQALLTPPGGTTTLGPPSIAASTLALLAWQSGRTFVVTLDGEGREKRRVQVATSGTADAGALPPAMPSDVLIDDEGRVAFVTPEGLAGVVDRDGTVRSLGETACARTLRIAGSSVPVALTPTGTGFLIACANGVLLDVEP